MPNNSLEAVFHRLISNSIPRCHQAVAMQALRTAMAQDRPGMLEIEIADLDHINAYLEAKNQHPLAPKAIRILGEWKLAVKRGKEAASRPHLVLVEGEPLRQQAKSECPQPQAHPARCGCEEPRV